MAASAAASIDPSGATPLDTSVAPYTVGIGSRKSALALAQSEIVVKLLREAWPQHEFRIDAIATMGDKDQQTALHQFNAKSLWTFELEAMLFEGKIDLIVHSCKGVSCASLLLDACIHDRAYIHASTTDTAQTETADLETTTQTSRHNSPPNPPSAPSSPAPTRATPSSCTPPSPQPHSSPPSPQAV